jgi:hypothetical protein
VGLLQVEMAIKLMHNFKTVEKKIEHFHPIFRLFGLLKLKEMWQLTKGIF